MHIFGTCSAYDSEQTRTHQTYFRAYHLHRNGPAYICATVSLESASRDAQTLVLHGIVGCVSITDSQLRLPAVAPLMQLPTRTWLHLDTIIEQLQDNWHNTRIALIPESEAASISACHYE